MKAMLNNMDDTTAVNKSDKQTAVLEFNVVVVVVVVVVEVELMNTIGV
jgi:hypothetical protein